MKNFLGVKILVIVYIILLMSSCGTKRSKLDQDEIIKTNNDIVSDWQYQKFSMFIHFGIYSIPAGIWDGNKITGYSEQIKGHAKIPTEEYRKLAHEFNPTLWNSDSIALLAKEAGMKSIVITAKHHDGFCMFDTKYSRFDIVDATPYKKDIIKDLSEACNRNGLKFGVYFSLIDWDYPGALAFTSTYNSDSIPPAHHEYNLKQVEELLSNYGEISELWFDMGAPTYEQSKEIADLVKQIQPNCLVSGRIWNDQGDFIVMGDNYTPDFKMGVPWQTPASMFHETWSYRSWQERTDLNDKIEEKIHDLLNIVSSGGNYLLNIGPKADGSVVPYEKNVLKGIGKWLKVNGEAVYNTNKSFIEKPEWGFITSKPGKLYLHVINFPENNKLILERVDSEIHKTYLLSDKSTVLNSKQINGNLEIELPDAMQKSNFATVIVFEYKGDLIYTPSKIVDMNEKEDVELNANNAVKYHSYSGHDYYSSKPTVIRMKWYLIKNTKENYNVFLTYNPDTGEDTLGLAINNNVYSIPFESEFISTVNNINSNMPIEIKLDMGSVNNVELSLENQSNPHKGLNIEGMKIIIR
jgi:alpha-L-fucosidase